MKRLLAAIILAIVGLKLAAMAGADYKAQDLFQSIAQEGEEKVTAIGHALNLLNESDSEKGQEGGYEKLEQHISEAEEELFIPATEDSSGLRISERFNKAAQEKRKKEELETINREIRPTTIKGGLSINNDTSFEINVSEIMSEAITHRLPENGYQVLIIHTHGSEAYTPEPDDIYEVSDSSRTGDKDYNVIRVGDELARELEDRGVSVLHDREIYDYPSYTGSYGRSQAAVESYLAEHPEIALVIDLHRDALGSNGVVYKTMAEVPDEAAAQIMLLVGTGENGLSHPQWRENLKMALYLQAEAENKYPTLMRPVALKKERYNQHLTTGSLILEVGSNGNTLNEALCAVRLLADAIAEPLLRLV